MPPAVARSGDVSATAGTTAYSGATSGTWTAATPALTTTTVLSCDGAVVTKATCSFSFSGTNGQSPVTGTSSVTLSPGRLALTVDGVSPLVDGDSAKDSYGNKLSVSSGAALTTA